MDSDATGNYSPFLTRTPDCSPTETLFCARPPHSQISSAKRADLLSLPDYCDTELAQASALPLYFPPQAIMSPLVVVLGSSPQIQSPAQTLSPDMNTTGFSALACGCLVGD